MDTGAWQCMAGQPRWYCLPEHTYKNCDSVADTADSVIVTFVTVANYSAPSPSTQTETVTYRLDSMGTFTLLSDSLVTPTANLTLTPAN